MTIRGWTAVILAGALAAACQAHGGAAPVDGAPDSVEAEMTQARCAAIGGDWRRGGLLGLNHCFRAPDDAGAQCLNSTQCEGLCELNDAGIGGQCSAQVPVFGCIALYEDGDTPTLCID